MSGAEDSQDIDEILTRISGLDEAKSASISRKRSLQRTSFLKSENAEKSKRTRAAHGKSTVVDISPHQRVQETPGEHLAADAGKLVCTACHSELSLKLSIIRSHVQSTRHQNGKASLEKEGNRQQLVKQSFLSYQERNKKSLTGCGLTEAVPIDHCLQRIEVVRSLLAAGVPL